MEEEVIMLEEVQVQPPESAEPVDLGYILACGERDIFDEGGSSLYSVSQLVRDLSTPTQEDPGVPAHSPEVEEALKPLNIECWASKMDAYMEGHDLGQNDPCFPSQSVEPPLGEGSSRQKFEQWSFQSEPTE